MKLEQKTQPNSPTTKLKGRMNQAEDRISGLKNKLEDVNQISQEYEMFKQQKK